MVAVGGPLDAGSVPGGIDGALVVGRRALVVAGPSAGRRSSPVVVGADVALVVDVAPAVVAGSPVVG